MGTQRNDSNVRRRLKFSASTIAAVIIGTVTGVAVFLLINAENILPPCIEVPTDESRMKGIFILTVTGLICLYFIRDIKRTTAELEDLNKELLHELQVEKREKDKERLNNGI